MRNHRVDDKKSVFYIGVLDRGYPRNRRIRQYLEREGMPVEGISDLRADLPKVRRWREFFSELFIHGRGKHVYILAEFSNRLVVPAWIWSKVQRATFVFDGFVGLYETRIGDWGESNNLSLKARYYRMLDRLGRALADVYLVDTDMRAEMTCAMGTKAVVVTLPVGAPDWARARPRRIEEPGSPLRVLYYGNYIPLHGLPTVLTAIKSTSESIEVSLTLVGNGRARGAIEALAHDIGVNEVCDFVDSVPETELAEIISEHDIVLGIFGGSEKAGSVIANKVWQGLASGKTVITQASPALAEIQGEVEEQLVLVPPEDGDSLARAIVEVFRSNRYLEQFVDASNRLEVYVDRRYEALGAALGPSISRGPKC